MAWKFRDTSVTLTAEEWATVVWELGRVHEEQLYDNRLHEYAHSDEFDEDESTIVSGVILKIRDQAADRVNPDGTPKG